MPSFLSDDAEVSLASFPFRHLVVENVFTDDLAGELLKNFGTGISKAAPIGKVGEVGELKYGALNYTPLLLDFGTSGVAVFAAEELQNFICGILGIRPNKYLMLGSHRHQPPSNDGWVHTDCTVVSFPSQGPRFGAFDIFQPNSGCNYADDSRDRQPKSVKMARAVACIYYLGNSTWRDGDGGETGIFDVDRTSVVKRIAPRHNSLLAFDISPISYHSYLAANNFARDTYIWWYHCGIDEIKDRHKDKFEMRVKSGQDPWDRWTGPDEPKYDISIEAK